MCLKWKKQKRKRQMMLMLRRQPRTRYVVCGVLEELKVPCSHSHLSSLTMLILMQQQQ